MAPSPHRLCVLILIALVAFGVCACSTDEDDDDASQPAPGDDDDDDADDGPDGVDWRFITDDEGRALILHGMNVTGDAKRDAGLPGEWFDREQALRLSADWGFDFARYLIFWARIEPDEPGVYDEAYLDAVETYLDWLDEAGLRVVLDMHQDVWGPFVHDDEYGSDGAPLWATITDGLPNLHFPNWAMNYLSPAVSRAFDNFFDYAAHPELQDAYGAMWAHVAERFADHACVLGYDLMNEPWQGRYLLDPREFDRTVYADFNRRAIDAIRAVDDERWIFVEPRAFGPNGGNPSWLPALVDPREGEARIAYFPHLYPVLIDVLGRWNPEHDHALDKWEDNRWLEAARQRAPLVAGEWSMLFSDSQANRFAWMNEALAMMDRVTSGWAYWDHSPHQIIDGDLNETPMADVLVRPYPRAIAGQPVEYGYDPETRIFTLTFEQRAGVSGPTEIYVPAERHYSNGWTLSVSDPEGTWDSTWDAEREVLTVTTDPERVLHTIRVLPFN